MMFETYGPGGYDPTRPRNNVLRWADDLTRLVTDYTVEPPAIRPYTPAENAAADARYGQAAQLDSIEARLARIEARLWPPAPPAAPRHRRQDVGRVGRRVARRGSPRRRWAGVAQRGQRAAHNPAVRVPRRAWRVDPPVRGTQPAADGRAPVGPGRHLRSG